MCYLPQSVMHANKLIGIVQTENRADAGRVVFTLLDETGNLIPCKSGAGYKTVTPKMGQRVALIGECKTDFIKREQLPEFIFYSLEILRGEPEMA